MERKQWKETVERNNGKKNWKDIMVERNNGKPSFEDIFKAAHNYGNFCTPRSTSALLQHNISQNIHNTVYQCIYSMYPKYATKIDIDQSVKNCLTLHNGRMKDSLYL